MKKPGIAVVEGFLRKWLDGVREPDKPSFNYWRNKGQVVDTELNPRADVKFYTDGGLPQTYLRGGSLISFTHGSSGGD